MTGIKRFIFSCISIVIGLCEVRHSVLSAKVFRKYHANFVDLQIIYDIFKYDIVPSCMLIPRHDRYIFI